MFGSKRPLGKGKFETKQRAAMPESQTSLRGESSKTRPVTQSLRLRFAALMGLLIVLFAGSVGLLQFMEGFEYREAISEEKQGKEELLRRVIELKGASLAQFANDYSQWDDMVAFAVNPTKEWAVPNIDNSLKNFQVHGVWVFKADGGLAYTATQGVPSGMPMPEFGSADPRVLFPSETGKAFYEVINGRLYECRAAGLRTSLDSERRGAIHGWFVVARLWDSELLDSLSVLAQGRAQFCRRGETVAEDANEAAYRITLPLAGVDGGLVGSVVLTGLLPMIQVSRGHDSVQLGVLLGFGLVAIGIVAYAVRIWVVTPLAVISTSLEGRGEAGLAGVEADAGELGRIAQLVREAARQKRELQEAVEASRRSEDALRRSEAELRRVVEERAALARNLHDGVIQTLYAAGMGVGGIAPLLRKDPEEAGRRLEKARLLLNEVIRDVRGFIEGLEPEGHKGSLSTALERMGSHMQALKSFALDLELEGKAEEALDFADRTHLLHISREAVSNALRHGGASRVWISMHTEGAGIAFVIRDDGRGIGASPTGGGQGLSNMAHRAEDMGATLSVSGGADGGTVLKLWIPMEGQS